MENKRINVSFGFGIVLIAFLVMFYILIKDFNTRRVNDFKEYAAVITNIVKQEHNKIRILSYQLAVKEKENEDLKNTLSKTRNDLEVLSKKLAQPAPVAAPANAPAPETAPAPAAVPASVAVTK